MAVAVCSLSSLPAAIRSSSAGASFFEGLLISVAVLLPFSTLSLLIARAARRGYRSIVGADASYFRLARIAFWLVVAVPVLAALAALLKAFTHHRALAGATIGFIGLIILVATFVLAHRVVAIGEHFVARGVRPWILSTIGVIVAMAPLCLVALLMFRNSVSPDLAIETSSSSGSAMVRAAILDGALLFGFTALVSFVNLEASVARIASYVGVPIAAVVMIAAAARIEASPSVGQAVRTSGGLAASVLAVLERWTDRDQDGMGSHFGGADCDEGDPTRHPNAQEIPGDGIDQDCDGIDPELFLEASSIPDPTSKQVVFVPSSAAPVDRAVMTPRPASVAVTEAKPKPRPDVFLITLDTVRADHTSAYGYEWQTTPRLAGLAARGVLFERAYAVASDTQRALCPLVTGRPLSRSARDRREWPTLLPDNDTVAERMKSAGYITAAVTSFTWLSKDRGFAQGFDRFETVYDLAHPERHATGHLALNKALAILADLAQRAQPIFLWVHLFDAHERYLEHPGIRFGSGTTAAYDGEIAYVDQQLGSIMDAVAQSDRGQTTIFIVHGSHGEGLGDHDVVGHGVELYEEFIRVPLIIALPGAASARYPHPVSTLDIAPTVLALADASAQEIDGQSLVSIAAGDLSLPHGPVFARAAKRSVVIDGPLKLMSIERKRNTLTRLFDLSSDPDESRDLSDARPEELQKMLEKLAAFEPPRK